MVKCPSCKEIIGELLNIQSGEKVWLFWVSNNGKTNYEEETFNPDCVTNDWICPECNHVIATSEDEAVKFLKGK